MWVELVVGSLSCSRDVFLRVHQFSPPLKIQHSQTPIRTGTHGHDAASSPELLSGPWVNKLQYTVMSFFLGVKTTARVYDVIGVNVFHCKIMRLHLIKRSFHIYYTTCVRACSRSFLQGPSRDFIHTAFNRFILSLTVSLTQYSHLRQCVRFLSE